MEGQDRVRTAFERNRKALELRSGIGRGTATTRVRVRDGLTCDVSDGDWNLVVDMPEKSGGRNGGPNPGILGRAALGTCLAMTYMMWLSKRGIDVDALEVEVEADYDARSYHGVGDVSPGYAALRWTVHVETEADEATLLPVLDEADSHCDFLADFSMPHDIRRSVRIAARRS